MSLADESKRRLRIRAKSLAEALKKHEQLGLVLPLEVSMCLTQFLLAEVEVELSENNELEEMQEAFGLQDINVVNYPKKH